MNEDIKKVLLDLLLKLDEVCAKHGLRYYIAYGTCLGALRHKGFIPWDHDIDVLMPVGDAKKLVSLQPEFGERYFVQCKETDPEYGVISYKLRDSETTCIWKSYRHCNFNQGLSIDIYPFYYAPKTRLGLQINIWRSYLYKVLVAQSLPIQHSGAVKLAVKAVQFLYPEKRRQRVIKRLEGKLMSVKDGKEILDYFGEDITFFSAITYPKEWFGEPKKIEFEGYLVNAPTEPEKYMQRRYGDYMTLPPEEKRVDPFDRPGAIVDAGRSYREYYERRDRKKNAKEKREA